MNNGVSMTGKRVALVTGGARGIGLGIAQALARDGMNIVVNGRKKENEITAALDKLRAIGTDILYVQCDVSSPSDRTALLQAIHGHFERLDVLVNNAGIAPETRADILEAGEESFDQLISVNLKGPYFLTQLLARYMIEQNRKHGGSPGVVINVSSVSATVASVNRGDYCISKAGIAMATKLWAVRLAEFGIAVYEVRPGVIRTDMTSGVTGKYDKLIAEGLTVDPRWGEPDDVGRAVSVLASGKLKYATGNVLMVDGGLTLDRL